jgi:hypothetical protein
MKYLLLSILLLPAFSGGASIRKAKVAKGDGLSSVVVSGEINADLSSEYFGYFDITLENKSDRWLTLSKIKVSFPDSQSANIRFVTGNDFVQWRDVMAKSIALDEANKKTAMAVVGALGYGLATLSGNRGLQTVGAAAAAGAAGAYAAQGFGNWQDSLERAKMFPENHLMGDTVRLLPGLYADRWLLLNSRNHAKMGYVTQVFIEIETTEGEKGRYTLEFRSKSGDASGWQASLKPKPACSTSGSTAYGVASGC